MDYNEKKEFEDRFLTFAELHHHEKCDFGPPIDEPSPPKSDPRLKKIFKKYKLPNLHTFLTR